MKIRSLASILAAFALTACGASDPAPQSAAQPSQTTGEAPEKHGHKGHGDHKGHKEGGAEKHNFPGAINTFHNGMAGLWHAEKGAERTQKTCDALATLKTQAEAIVAEAVPEKAAANAEAYKLATAGLVTSIDTLSAACGADGRPEFELKFHEVHEAFHAIVKNLGHEKHKGAEHKHGEHKGHHKADGEKHGKHKAHGEHKGHDKGHGEHKHGEHKD